MKAPLRVPTSTRTPLMLNSLLRHSVDRPTVDRYVSLYCRSAGIRIDTAVRGSGRLEEAELELCGVRHPVPIPRRIPDDIHLHIGDFRDFRDALLDLTWQELSGRTCRRC